ncbi:general substrate transporter [Exophiala viscosa]|uniref:General substrate transporter n=1 Tax=Exophiala viscosa TaxID=2486360 RepID=A0AAN6E167_9EURO|nr:general substrate transporter [Exophiala viscosa]KAI1623934.1 general substrate transporter [Exophiala viscosa]
MGLSNLQGRSLQRLIATLSSIAFLVQGYNQSVMNGFTTLPTFLAQIPQLDTVNTTGHQQSHNATIFGLVVAMFELGSALGALSCIFVGDRLGRPKTMLLAGIICIIGVVIQGSTFSLGQIIAGRIITGLGIGLYTGTIPMYVSETAEANHRGPLVLLEGPFALGGLAIASWVNFGMFYASGPVTWRFPICLQLAFLAIIVSLTPLLPESPRWLVKKERMEDATRVMARLMGLPVNDGTVVREVAIIQAAVARDAGHRHKYSSNPFSMNENRHFHRLVLAMVATAICQLTGINVIAFYSTSIFETTLGYSGRDARVFTACLQVTLALGGLTAIFLVERVGRRRLMLFSTGCMCLAQAAVAGLSSDLQNPNAGRAAIFFYFFALYTLPIGMFVIPFMYGAEIAPLGIRHKVTAMGAATSWLFNFMVAEVTLTAFENIAWRYNIVYACTSAAGVLVIYLFYPETRGRSLEEIDEIFLASKSIFDPVRVAKQLPMGGTIILDPTEGAKDSTGVGHTEKV